MPLWWFGLAEEDMIVDSTSKAEIKINYNFPFEFSSNLF